MSYYDSKALKTAPAPEQPPSNVTEKRQPVKRKRETPASRLSASSSKNGTPNAYARRSPPRDSRPREPSPIRDDSDNERARSRSPPRKLKRPGAGARMRDADIAAAEAARRRREADERNAITERQTAGAEMVAEHYNAVPERGREWRKTDSLIKGLRSLNNWIKSTLIQKFSRPDIPVQHLTVLDMACGKGGDLGKWEKAPQIPSLYVGCDIADISIAQARERWNETLRKSRGRHGRPVQMRAEFSVQDTFGRSLAEVPMVRQVGFNPNAGPGGGIIQPGMPSGGFDVVSMMFALHYSFESEVLARGMLQNVAGALKKGGRFIGVMPNSDVISATVKKLLQAEAAGKTPNGKPAAVDDKAGSEDGEVEEEDDWDPEKPSEKNGTTVEANGEDDDDWDPERPSEPQPTTANGTANGEDDDDWDPEKPAEASTADTSAPSEPRARANGTPAAQSTPATDSHLPPLEWGNKIYTVRFPRVQHPSTARDGPTKEGKSLPKDGIFRPPYGWRYHYQLEEAVDVPEYVVPWEGFRALAEDYGLELMYRKGFREVLDEIWEGEGVIGGGVSEEGRQLGMLAERMGVLSRDRSQGRGGLLVGEEEMEAAGFYHAFCFYRT